MELNLENAKSAQSAEMHVMLWLVSYRRQLLAGHQAPAALVVVTSKGKDVVVNGALEARHAVATLLHSLGSPFQVDRERPGCLVASGPSVTEWLRERSEAELVGESTGVDGAEVTGESLISRAHVQMM